MEPQPPQYVWVDGKTGKPYTDNAWLRPTEEIKETFTEFRRRTWNANAKSQELWQRINPGGVASNLKLPDSHMKETFKYDTHKLDEKKWDYHLTKNNYTEWVNQMAKEEALNRALGYSIKH